MMSFLHLNCKFAAKIEIFDESNKLFEVVSTSSLQNEIDLQVLDIKNFTLKIYPLGKTNNVAYSANILVENDRLISKNTQIKVFTLPQNHYYFVILPLKIEQSNFDEFDKIEIDGGKIKTLTLLNTIKKRAEVKVFESSGNKVKQTENYYVNLKNEQPKNFNPAIILLKFFQDLCVSDYSSANEYFTTQLSQKLSKNVLANFFDKFDECCLVNYYDDFAVLLLNLKEEKAKVFGASFENNLISNIYEIE